MVQQSTQLRFSTTRLQLGSIRTFELREQKILELMGGRANTIGLRVSKSNPVKIAVILGLLLGDTTHNTDRFCNYSQSVTDHNFSTTQLFCSYYSQRVLSKIVALIFKYTTTSFFNCIFVLGYQCASRAATEAFSYDVVNLFLVQLALCIKRNQSFSLVRLHAFSSELFLLRVF